MIAVWFKKSPAGEIEGEIDQSSPLNERSIEFQFETVQSTSRKPSIKWQVTIRI
jgi:hypothetical protein